MAEAITGRWDRIGEIDGDAGDNFIGEGQVIGEGTTEKVEAGPKHERQTFDDESKYQAAISSILHCR